MKRKQFIKQASLTGIGLALASTELSCNKKLNDNKDEITKSAVINKNNFPIAVCTWSYHDAIIKAGAALTNGKKALEAAINGVAVEEENIKNSSVGKGGAPDREGHVTLDACVMDSNGNCGSVVFVENITHVAALAKEVMINTPHVMLAGKAAEDFAYSRGFKKEQLLTSNSKKAWEDWKKTSKYKPIINVENHDTIGMLCIDNDGDLAGVCSTSGLAYKMRGRVGDSPIIGSGLYVDNEIGAAVATGLGEEVLKTVGSFLIVELMRNGISPQASCRQAIERIVGKNKNYKNFQVAYLAVNKAGDIGAYSIHNGFTYMQYKNGKSENIKSPFYNQ